jgi:hypothetical protein
MSGWGFDQRIVSRMPDRDSVVPSRRSTRYLRLSDFCLVPYDFVAINREIGGNSHLPTHRAYLPSASSQTEKSPTWLVKPSISFRHTPRVNGRG